MLEKFYEWSDGKNSWIVGASTDRVFGTSIDSEMIQSKGKKMFYVLKDESSRRTVISSMVHL